MSDNEEFESSESEEEESEEEESEDGDSAEGESFLSEGNHGFVFRVFFFSKLDFSVATLRLKKYSQEKNKSHWQIENRL